MYRERPSIIPGAVVWESVSTGAATRIVPDGCIDVISLGGRLIVAGPDSTARHHRSEPGAGATGLRFAPGQAPAVLRVSAVDLLDRTVGLDDLLGGRVSRTLTERMAAHVDAAAFLEASFLEPVLATDERERTAIVARLRAGQSVETVAVAAGIGLRQLHRRSLAWFGYGPKQLAMVLRLQRALDAGRSGSTFADVAARCGYADQAHLARDARRLGGTTFGALVA